MAKKFTRSQKCWIVALGLGLCVLVADRLTRTADALAIDPDLAGMAVAAPSEPAAEQVRPIADPVTGPFDGVLAERISRLLGKDASAEVRDGFTAANGRLGGAATGSTAGMARVELFKHAHVLKAVVHSAENDQAMVDSNLVSVGQSFDGFVLVSVGSMRATFQTGNLIANLTIQTSDSLSAEQSR